MIIDNNHTPTHISYPVCERDSEIAPDSEELFFNVCDYHKIHKHYDS